MITETKVTTEEIATEITTVKTPNFLPAKYTERIKNHPPQIKVREKYTENKILRI